jgi:putative transposase
LKFECKKKDFLHKLSREIVTNHDEIYVEDLEIAGMMNRSSSKKKNKFIKSSIKKVINRKLQMASIGTLYQLIAYKAQQAGKYFGTCNPNRTSTTCHCCGAEIPGDLSMREIVCANCQLVAERDFNASQNILKLGMLQKEYNARETKWKSKSSPIKNLYIFGFENWKAPVLDDYSILKHTNYRAKFAETISVV